MQRDRLDPFVRSSETAGIFLDFDGTLSEIVLVPHDARPLDEVPELLARLARRYRVVSVISGRSAAQLLEWLGTGVEIWGTHGAERVVGDEVLLAEHAQPFAELMGRVRKEAEERIAALDLPGVVVEDKRVMVGLHFRAAADVTAARSALDRLADEL